VQFAAERDLASPQFTLENEIDSALTPWGLQGTTNFLLVGADGKLLAAALRHDTLAPAVEDALRP
jgi:hypothetical protein